MINSLKEIIVKAGQEAMSVYNRDFSIEEKEDKSPVTEADILANTIIVAGLESLSQKYPILSEETKAADFSIRQNWPQFWLVDPIDGTKEFIKKNGEFTVNIALIEGNIPTLGFVYAPAIETLYYGGSKLGHSFKVVNGIETKIHISNPKSSPLKVVGSRSHGGGATEDFIIRHFSNNFEMLPMGSSLKLCLVAEGVADIYPRIGPTMEWDTGAAHAVLIGAGGTCKIVTENFDISTDLIYNKKNLLNPYFVCQ